MFNRLYHCAITIILLTAGAGAYGQSPSQAPTNGIFARSGSITIKVPSFDVATVQVGDVARTCGGDLVSSTTRTDDKGRKYGSLVYDVPVDKVATLYSSMGMVGKLYSQKFDAVGNQSEYESLARRVDSLNRHQGRLAGILSSPRRMRGGDILFLQERLFRADVAAQLLLQQRQDLLNASQTAAIRISLFEPGTPPAQESTAKIDLGGWYRFGLLRARHEFERTVAHGATGGAYALVYAPIWLPILFVALLILWILWRMRKRIAAAILGCVSALLRPFVNAGRQLRAAITRRVDRGA